MEANNGLDTKWWINTLFTVHLDMKSHTGATMSFGKGSVYSMSRKQWINTKSLTEAEMVGIDDGMLLVIWTWNFILVQGYKIKGNVVFQDNQSAMLLEKNGRASRGQCT